MASDASIYGMMRPPQPGPGPLELAGQGLQVRHLMDQGQLSALQRKQLESAMAEDEAVKAAFGGMQPGQTIADILPQVMKASPKTGVSLQKSVTEQQQAAATLKKTDLESHGLEMKQLRDKLAAVTTDQQLQQFMQEAARLSGGKGQYDGPSSVNDPGFAAWRQQSLLTADQLIERMKSHVQPVSAGGQTVLRETNPNAAGFNAAPIEHTPTPGDLETRRHNSVTEAQARDAAARDKYGPAQEVTGPDGKPRLVMQRKGDGALVDANTREPVSGVGPKSGEAAQKQLGGVAAVKDAIVEYRDALKKWGALDLANPDARARMGTIYNNMLLQAKEAYNLGVLNGPDYQILQEVVTNPATLKGGLTSKKALDDQAAKLDELMGKVGQRVTQQQSGIAAPAAPQQPSRADIDAELRRRGMIR